MQKLNVPTAEHPKLFMKDSRFLSRPEKISALIIKREPFLNSFAYQQVICLANVCRPSSFNYIFPSRLKTCREFGYEQ